MTSWTARLGDVDQRLYTAFVARRTPALDRLMRAITVAGDPPVMVGVSATLLLVLEGSARGVLNSVLLVVVLSHGVVQVMKRLAARPRPCLPVGARTLIRAPDRFSFPSGHATAALAFVLPVLPGLSIWLAAPVLGFALLVGASCCYLGVHYPGDVVIGWVIAVGTWSGAMGLGWIS